METMIEAFPNMAEEELTDLTLEYYEEMGLEDFEDVRGAVYSKWQVANIDQESLDNITKIDLLKKKKKEAQEPEITSKNKKKITMPKKASIFVKSNMTKEQLLAQLEDFNFHLQSFSTKKG